MIKAFVRKQIKFQSEINSTCSTHDLLFTIRDVKKGLNGSIRLYVRITINWKQTFRSSSVDNKCDMVVIIAYLYVAVLSCLFAIAINCTYIYAIFVCCVPVGMHSFNNVFTCHAAACTTAPSAAVEFVVIIA